METTADNYLSPAESGRHVAAHAEHVKINSDGIKGCAEFLVQRLQSDSISLGDLFVKTAVHPREANEEAIDWVFFADALNFSFWNNEDQPQYTVTYKGEKYTGYLSMCAAINRTLDQGIKLTNPAFFKDITEDQLNEYLLGDNNVPCPMIKERVKVLRDVADVLLAKYDGTFVNCVEASKHSAQDLLKLIFRDFSCFRDVAAFAGEKVSILKRAQILVADIWALYSGKGAGHFTDIDALTMFADYRVPQSLQYFGAIQYSQELLSILSEDKLLSNGDKYEVEIRGCSIEAVTQIVDETKKLLPPSSTGEAFVVNSILADYFLWGFRREKQEEMKRYPYHKVRSIFY